MYNQNGFSELAKQMFEHSPDDETLKAFLTSQYSESDLIRYLKSEEPLGMRAAASALKLIGGEMGIPALIDALKADDLGTCFSAESALWHIWARSGDEAVDAMLSAGKALLKEEAYEKAVECFTKVIDAAPEFAEGYNQRAIAYFLLEELSKSVRDCKRAVVLNPNHFGALAGMGHVYVKLGKLGAAISAYKQALAINPNLFPIAETVLRLQQEYEIE